MTIKRKSNPTPTAADLNSVKKPRLDQDPAMDEGRPITEKEKRKAARMIRNRQSAQISRNKKQEHLDRLEATVARLQAENKDLASRLIEQNTRSIVHGGGAGERFALPLSPDPSSIVERKRELGWDTGDGLNAGDNCEEEDDDDDDDHDEDQDDFSSFPSSSQRGVSSVPPTQAQTHTQQTSPSSALARTPAPEQSGQETYAHVQALVSLSTENATLKERLARLEKVVQLLLGMNAGGGGGAAGAVGPMTTTPTMDGMDEGDGDVLRLLGPDRKSVAKGGRLDTQPFVSQFNVDVNGMNDNSLHHSATIPNINTDISKLVHQASLVPPTPNQTSQHPSQSPNLIFPTTENQDHARHPAAMTTTLSASDELRIRRGDAGSALQRACFSPSLVLASKSMSLNKKGSREQEDEQEELRGKVLSGLKRVLEWRSTCLGMGMMPEQWERTDLASGISTGPGDISSVA